MPGAPREDRDLLRRIAAGDDDAFSAFYRAHLDAVVAFFRRRVPDGELAFDLAAETFAAVVIGATSYAGDGPAAAWLYGIATRPVLSDSAPLPEITAALPSLASPAPDDDQARALSMLPRGGGTGGAVLRGTARTITVPGGVTLLVYVQQGAGIGAVRDPDACGQARRERAEALDKNRSEDVKRWAERRLAQLRDTAPRLQTLWVSAKMTGRSATGGSGMPVRPGQPLHPALVFSGSVGRRRSVYVGIAGPRASRVLVRAQRGARIPGAPARVPVRQGFYAVVLPAGTGPVRLNEVTANGTRLRVVRLRG
jgi:RNA polymerase sigma-70 factor (ECF subfamily)